MRGDSTIDRIHPGKFTRIGVSKHHKSDEKGWFHQSSINRCRCHQLTIPGSELAGSLLPLI